MLGPDSRLLTALLVAASAALLVAAVRLPPAAGQGPLRRPVDRGGDDRRHRGGQLLLRLLHDLGSSCGPTSTAAPATSAPSPTATTHDRARVRPPRLDQPARQAQRLQPARPGVPAAAVRPGPVRAGPVPGRRAVPRHPGLPAGLGHVLRISQVADSLLARHLIGPMVLVMPAINGAGHDYQDCVNGPGRQRRHLPHQGRARRRARPLPGQPRPLRVGHGRLLLRRVLRGQPRAAPPRLLRRRRGHRGLLPGRRRPRRRRAEPQPAPGSRQQPAVPRREAHPGQRPRPRLLGRRRHPRQDRLPAGDRVHGRAGPHRAGPLRQAQRRATPPTPGRPPCPPP